MDEILNDPIREQGMTLEEIEHSLRSNKALERDLENSEFINQFRAALKFGLSKGRYVKEGKFHKVNKFPPKVCSSKCMLNFENLYLNSFLFLKQ